MILVYPFGLLGVDIRGLLALLTIGMGLLIFSLSTTTWLYGKLERREIIDFWIYKYSRHPQYLGFLVWSYGVLLLATISPFPKGGYAPGPSLPWAISALIIICVALKEEIDIVERYGERYLKYQASTPSCSPYPISFLG